MIKKHNKNTKDLQIEKFHLNYRITLELKKKMKMKMTSQNNNQLDQSI